MPLASLMDLMAARRLAPGGKETSAPSHGQADWRQLISALPARHGYKGRFGVKMVCTAKFCKMLGMQSSGKFYNLGVAWNS